MSVAFAAKAALSGFDGARFVSGGPVAASAQDMGTGSPVHAMQAKLEEAVFASFSAKEAVPMPASGRFRTVALVGVAAAAGWGLIAAGAALNFY